MRIHTRLLPLLLAALLALFPLALAAEASPGLAWDRLALGMSREEVTDLLGKPMEKDRESATYVHVSGAGSMPVLAYCAFQDDALTDFICQMYIPFDKAGAGVLALADFSARMQAAYGDDPMKLSAITAEQLAGYADGPLPDPAYWLSDGGALFLVMDLSLVEDGSLLCLTLAVAHSASLMDSLGTPEPTQAEPLPWAELPMGLSRAGVEALLGPPDSVGDNSIIYNHQALFGLPADLICSFEDDALRYLCYKPTGYPGEAAAFDDIAAILTGVYGEPSSPGGADAFPVGAKRTVRWRLPDVQVELEAITFQQTEGVSILLTLTPP